MSDIEALKQEAENLRRKIRVSSRALLAQTQLAALCCVYMYEWGVGGVTFYLQSVIGLKYVKLVKLKREVCFLLLY